MSDRSVGARELWEALIVAYSEQDRLSHTGAASEVGALELEREPDQERGVARRAREQARVVRHQLGAAPEDQLLMIKYLGVPAPFAPFYQGGLAALNEFSATHRSLPFAELTHADQTELVGQFAHANPDGWQGPPGPFFYFVLRNDAVDVVYGTKNGIESLGIPYMAHIEPPSRWGE